MSAAVVTHDNGVNAIASVSEQGVATLGGMHVVADVEPRLPEIGRLRLGEPKSDPRRPGKPLLTFRISSPQREVLEAVQAVYPGGQIIPWRDAPGGPQWQMVSTAASLAVAIPPDEQAAFSSYYEQWGASGCLVRCNGDEALVAVPPVFREVERNGKRKREVVKDGYFEPRPCATLCADPKNRECSLTSRLNVVLLDVQQFGVFRLESHSWYFAKEAPGVVRLAARFAQNGLPVPATLSILKRQTKSPVRGQRDFLVPVLRLAISVSTQMLLGAGTVTTTTAPRQIAPSRVAPAPEQPDAGDEPVADDDQAVGNGTVIDGDTGEILEDNTPEFDAPPPLPSVEGWRGTNYAEAMADKATYFQALSDFQKALAKEGCRSVPSELAAAGLTLGQILSAVSGGAE